MAHVTNNLAGYLEGSLAPEARERVERHLVACAACRAALADLRAAGLALIEAGRSVPLPSADDALWARVHAGIAPAPPRRALFPRWAFAGGAAVSAAVLGIMVAMRPGVAPLPPEEPPPMVARAPAGAGPNRPGAQPAMESPVASPHAAPEPRADKSAPVAAAPRRAAPKASAAVAEAAPPAPPEPGRAVAALPSFVHAPAVPAPAVQAPPLADSLVPPAASRQVFAYAESPRPAEQPLALAAPLAVAEERPRQEVKARATAPLGTMAKPAGAVPVLAGEAMSDAIAAVAEPRPESSVEEAKRLFARAESSRALGRTAPAERYYDDALAAGLPDVEARRARIALGDMAVKEGRDAEALENYRAALEAAKDAPLLARVGAVYERLGRRAEAEEAYREALALSPSNKDARAGLERVKARGR